MTGYFADTSFWIALSSRRDAHHTRAVAWSLHLTRTNAATVTTEAVLWEWMNALSDPATRRTATNQHALHLLGDFQLAAVLQVSGDAESRWHWRYAAARPACTTAATTRWSSMK